MEKNISVIKPCTCTGEGAAKYQDETYGQGNRVHTPINKNRSDRAAGPQYRCTVCGQEKV